MELWKEYKIEDICEQIFAGGDAAKYNSSKHQTALYNIPIYANSTEKEGLYGYCDKAIVLSPAVTIAARGAGIGFVAFRNKPFVPIVRLITLITNNSVDTKFLYYYLKNRRLSGDGSAIPQITVPMVKKEVVTIPALEEQKRIADILSSLDAKIELNRRINDNLEQQAQLLFDNLINASDWSTTQFLSELSEINPPRKLSKGEYAPFVEMSNMPTSGSFPSRIDYKEYNGGMKFRNGDTIMARITPCLENGKAAYVNFLKENEIGFGSTEYIVLAPKKTISSSFLYFLVRNKEFVDYAVKHMNGSSGRQRVSGDTIGNYQLPILDRNKLSIFIAIADRTLSKIRQNSFEIINLAKQRDTLLPKLMFGELKINDLNC